MRYWIGFLAGALTLTFGVCLGFALALVTPQEVAARVGLAPQAGLAQQISTDLSQISAN